MKRDFSEANKENLLGIVKSVENEKLCDLTDWIGDRWFDFEEFTGALDIKHYVNNVNEYHRKVIDKNNTSADKINEIFSQVHDVDNSYGPIIESYNVLNNSISSYIQQMADLISPGNGSFTSDKIANTLKEKLSDFSKSKAECLKNRMMQNINGELIFNEDLIYEYLKKDAGEISQEEAEVLVETISYIQNAKVYYETLAEYGTDEFGATIARQVAWMADDKKYKSFTAVSIHYNDLYINVLNAMEENAKDQKSIAYSLVKMINGDTSIELFGTEVQQDLKKIFGDVSFTKYVAHYKNIYTDAYFSKLELTDKTDIDSLFSWDKEFKEKSDKDKPTRYFDKYGNEINEDDVDVKYYDRAQTIFELKNEAKISQSLFEGNYENGNTKIKAVVGNAEAHADLSAGLYVLDCKGNKKFSPGVNAEIGASVTALESSWDQQWLGDENLGLSTNVTATAGKASAKANATAQLNGEDGKLNIQLNGGAEAEAIAGEIKGSANANILGGGVGVTGSVNFGVGAHAKVGLKDGVIKCDVGASLGLGVSGSFEIDVGGMINTVAGKAESFFGW